MNVTNAKTGKSMNHLIKINTSGLFKEIVESNDQMWIMKIPLQQLLKILAEVGERAAEIDDPKLNALMMRLGIYSISDPGSPEFDQAFVSDYIEKAYSK